MTAWQALQTKMKQYLCPPGNGVYTVHTGRERREGLQQRLYGQSGAEEVQKIWEQSLAKLPQNKLPVVLGICSDTGGGILRGANWGPLFLRDRLSQAMPGQYFDVGDVRVIPHLLHDKYLNEATISNCRKALYNASSALLPVAPLSITEDFVADFYRTFPEQGLFGIGGDHSVSYALVRPFLTAQRERGVKTAVIHFDAHTDLLRERLGIDICFGSWVPPMLELLADPSHFIQIGVRSSGKDRGHWEQSFGLQQFWSSEVKARGPRAIADDIIVHLKQAQIQELYISFDIDAIDSEFAGATGTPEASGMAPHEAAVIIRALCDEFKLKSADMMELAPFLNTSLQTGTMEPESTLIVASSLSQIMLEYMGKAGGKN